MRFGPLHVRVTARLIEIATGHAVWSDRLDCNRSDAHAAHDLIAAKVCAAVRAVVLPTIDA